MGEQASKSYLLEFKAEKDYLSAYVSGEKDSLEICRQYWREIAAECGKADCERILIVEDIKGNLSMPQMFTIASEIPRMGFYGVRIAFVDLHLEQQSLNKFGEIVATNRGLQGKIFNDVEEAKSWLLSK